MKTRTVAPVVGAWMAVFFLAGFVEAAYDDRSTDRYGEMDEESTFEEAVDLERFRQGNELWDTQELIASGFKALHKDNERILKELERLKAAVERLEGKGYGSQKR
ncbi:MAG: hypothetical protein NC910_03050 [Candidatus Omnitrophica bacterium]|nr:hypothetical protein [Candidatus Omnitrophota bacterium]